MVLRTVAGGTSWPYFGVLVALTWTKNTLWLHICLCFAFLLGTSQPTWLGVVEVIVGSQQWPSIILFNLLRASSKSYVRPRFFLSAGYQRSNLRTWWLVVKNAFGISVYSVECNVVVYVRWVLRRWDTSYEKKRCKRNMLRDWNRNFMYSSPTATSVLDFYRSR
jgi:hypothetical protein